MREVSKVVPHKRPITVRGKELQVDLAALQATFGSANQDFVVGLVRQLRSIPLKTRTSNSSCVGPVARSPHVLVRRLDRRLTSDLRDRLIAACTADLAGLRDRAMIAVGYDMLCRCSELVALRVEDLDPRPSGGANLLVRRGKADQDGNGRIAALSQRTVGLLKDWLAAADIEHGPMFRRKRAAARAESRSHARAPTHWRSAPDSEQPSRP
jgi:integrase